MYATIGASASARSVSKPLLLSFFQQMMCEMQLCTLQSTMEERFWCKRLEKLESGWALTWIELQYEPTQTHFCSIDEWLNFCATPTLSSQIWILLFKNTYIHAYIHMYAYVNQHMCTHALMRTPTGLIFPTHSFCIVNIFRMSFKFVTFPACVDLGECLSASHR